ncbi:MAG: glycosyltransferase family 4 protein [Rhodospirillales bacterium]|jgi:glycosyltransferase involved in cell wall biosynthesis|nr:glycosyltransferase family 4 protein [Rhodospirillales bacterium]
MRIAFYAPMKSPDHPTPSGDRRMARALMAALTLGGHQVDLASQFRSYDSDGDRDNQERLRDMGSRLGASMALKLLDAPETERPEAWFTYHLYHKAPDWIGPQISEALGIPYFVAEASFAPKQAGGPWEIGHDAVAATLAEADGVFTLNPSDAECVIPLLRSEDRHHSILAFLDPSPFDQAIKLRASHRNQIADKFHIPSAPPWLLTVAMMRDGDKLASYRILAEALQGVRELPWQLAIVGDGPAAAETKALFEPLDKRVTFLGSLENEDLPAIYAACDVYVWPSVNEAYGMALLEAQAAGLPVVAADVGGVGSIVADGDTGLLTPTPEPSKIADALTSILEDPPLHREFRRAAAERVREHHSIAGAAKALSKVVKG